MQQEPHQILYEMVAQHNETLVRMEQAHARMEQSYHNMVATIQEHEMYNSECRQKLLSMVPAGDVDAHRRWHEADIKRMEARAATWQDIQRSVAKWGAVAIVGWVIVAMWHEGVNAIKIAIASGVGK